MKKYMSLFLLLAFLSGCAGTPQATPTPTETPATEVIPTPTPELELDLEPWQAAYVEILRGYEVRRDGFASDIRDLYQENYTLYDIDKDGLPELFLIGGFDEASRSCQVYFWQDGFAIEAGGHQEGYMEGALDFWHGGLFTCPGENGVLWSRGYDYNKVSLIDGDLVGSSLNGTLSKDISTDEITAELFVLDTEELCCYEPSDLQPILDYVLPLTPWQVAYWDILTNPGKYEGFYAVAEHIPSDNADNVSWYLEDPYTFAVEDINGDGIPELLLGLGIRYRSPQVLLNILRYNEKTGAVEDIDGPRTYPLMDNLWFSDTGCFSSINGAGGLYTEFWHLEDPDPEHYWYGYERTGQFNEEGELISVEEFPFRSSDGKEKFTLREYYDLLGESGIGVEWIELTEENIRQVFLVAGEP